MFPTSKYREIKVLRGQVISLLSVIGNRLSVKMDKPPAEHVPALLAQITPRLPSLQEMLAGSSTGSHGKAPQCSPCCCLSAALEQHQQQQQQHAPHGHCLIFPPPSPHSIRTHCPRPWAPSCRGVGLGPGARTALPSTGSI